MHLCMSTYTSASYRIAAGVASSSPVRADQDRSTRSPSIGGARGRGARRGLAGVRGSST